MSKTILTFDFNTDKAQWKKGRFEIDELEIMGDDEDLDIEYDDIKFYIDDKLYEGGISTWAEDNVSTDFLFESVLNSYLRNNTSEFDKFGDEWSIFSKIKNLTVEDDGLIIKLPRYDYGLQLFELDLAIPGFRYYSYNDYCMLLNEEGEILTNMENFYFDSLVEDICKVLKEETKCLYKSENVDYMIKEAGGKESFLAEYDMD